jgi:hypothetical protein
MPAKGQWRDFEEAREFARGLGFNSQREWFAWSKSGARPVDIPTHLQVVYKGQRQDWGDWLSLRLHISPGRCRPTPDDRTLARPRKDS